jgi:membrane protease YdiL (CAAX protease family)
VVFLLSLCSRIWDYWNSLHQACLDDDFISSDNNEQLSRRPALDKEPIIALITVAVSLTMINAFVKSEYWYQQLCQGFLPVDFQLLGSHAYWAVGSILFYTLPPFCMLWLQGKRIRDYGVSVEGMRQHLGIYLVMICIMAPVVWLASQREAFLTVYPFYKQVNRSYTDLIIWEGLYALQFVALEFFFRGYLLFSLRRKLGVYAIFVMMVPYCMIHFSKPTLETFASIIAGIALGTVALATRSIWWGAMLHIAVAWTMDTLAVWRMR